MKSNPDNDNLDMDEEKISVLREKYEKFRSNVCRWNWYVKSLKNLNSSLEKFIEDRWEQIEKEYPLFKKDYKKAIKKLHMGYTRKISNEEDVLNFLGGLEEIIEWARKDENHVRKELKKNREISEKYDKKHSGI